MSKQQELYHRLFPFVNEGHLEVLPALPEQPLEALEEFCRLIDNGEFDTCSLTVSNKALSNAALRECGVSLHESAVGVAELTALCLPWWQETAFYIDRSPDSAGHHRVYVWDLETYPGHPWGAFPSINAALECFCAAAEEEEPTWERLSDAHEKSAQSGGRILEELLQDDILTHCWEQAKDGSFEPDSDLAPIEADEDDTSPGWQRRLCLAKLQCLVSTGCFDVSDEASARLSEPHRCFVKHLRELEGALQGKPPQSFIALAKEPGDLQEAAEKWLSAFNMRGDSADSDVDNAESDALEREVKKTLANAEATLAAGGALGVGALYRRAFELLQQGKPLLSIALFELLITQEYEDTSLYCNALYLVQEGNCGELIPERHQRFLDACLPHAPANPTILVNAACLYVELRDIDGAFDVLHRAVELGNSQILNSREEPLFQSVFREPRFRELLTKAEALRES